MKRLVWCEAFDTRDDAFRRERQMKVWRRAGKIELIETTNPGWRGLYPEICRAPDIPDRECTGRKPGSSLPRG